MGHSNKKTTRWATNNKTNQVGHTLSSPLPSPSSTFPEQRSHSANPSRWSAYFFFTCICFNNQHLKTKHERTIRKNSFIAFLSPSSGSNSNPVSSSAVEKDVLEDQQNTSGARLVIVLRLIEWECCSGRECFPRESFSKDDAQPAITYTSLW